MYAPTPGSIVLTAEARIRTDSRAEFLAAAATLREASRKEPGVVSFGFYEDPLDQGLFFFREEYRDQDAMDAHMAQEHTRAYTAVQRGWLAEAATVRLHTTAQVTEFPLEPAR